MAAPVEQAPPAPPRRRQPEREQDQRDGHHVGVQVAEQETKERELRDGVGDDARPTPPEPKLGRVPGVGARRLGWAAKALRIRVIRLVSSARDEPLDAHRAVEALVVVLVGRRPFEDRGERPDGEEQDDRRRRASECPRPQPYAEDPSPERQRKRGDTCGSRSEGVREPKVVSR
ncbi:MAG: hypothetical protein M0R74_08005 [Dehalococcoidia bacterium]|nr:hypothetical protein [Dehalococcoidia bacterium]